MLLHIPRGFNAALPAVMIVYLHGNFASLAGVVHRVQQVPRQVSESGLNAVLVAPQLAVNAADSSAGRFYDAGEFRRFVEEAAVRLARLHRAPSARAAIESLPVIIVAYSGGYAPAAWAAHHGGIGDRLRGIILLDALYAEMDKFAAWIERRGSAFFFSAYSRSSYDENAVLQRMLTERGIHFRHLASRAAGVGQRHLPTHRGGCRARRLRHQGLGGRSPPRGAGQDPRLPPHPTPQGPQALTPSGWYEVSSSK